MAQRGTKGVCAVLEGRVIVIGPAQKALHCDAGPCQAVSLHLKILAECGLLTMKQQGRERICEARLEKLNEVDEWILQYKQFWETKLDALGLFYNGIGWAESIPGIRVST